MSGPSGASTLLPAVPWLPPSYFFSTKSQPQPSGLVLNLPDGFPARLAAGNWPQEQLAVRKHSEELPLIF
jgi:hypothetical protein